MVLSARSTTENSIKVKLEEEEETLQTRGLQRGNTPFGCVDREMSTHPDPSLSAPTRSTMGIGTSLGRRDSCHSRLLQTEAPTYAPENNDLVSHSETNTQYYLIRDYAMVDCKLTEKLMSTNPHFTNESTAQQS